MSGSVKILIVEDEVLIGMDLALTLEDAGFAVLGPFNAADKALHCLQTETPRFAVLDLNLGQGHTSEPVAEHLNARGIPFVFLTGYSASSHAVVKRFPDTPCLSKPADMTATVSLIEETVQPVSTR